MAEYPEHEKLMKVKDESQVIGEFLEGCGYTLCEFQPEADEPRWIDEDTGAPSHVFADNAVENFAWYPEGYYPVRGGINEILAGYFGIDLDKIEDEKRQMLEELRTANA